VVTFNHQQAENDCRKDISKTVRIVTDPFMKSKIQLFLCICVGFLLGAIITCFYEHQVYQKKLLASNNVLKTTGDYWLIHSLASSVFENSQLLIGLRRGKTEEAIIYLEDHLSENICDLVSDYPSGALSDTNCINSLKLAAHYRAEHPYKTGREDVDKAVEKVLLDIDSKRGKSE